jgi:hypothetical protein
MAKPFHKQLSELNEEIEELKFNRAHLEQLLRSGFDLDPPRRRGTAKRRRPRPRSARRASETKDRTQMSFEF